MWVRIPSPTPEFWVLSPVMVSGADCKSVVSDLLCSNRRAPTRFGPKVFTDARWLVTPEEWGSLPPRTARLLRVREEVVLAGFICQRSQVRILHPLPKGGNVIIAKVILTIIGYWIGMGVAVAALMTLFYLFAVIIGDVAERLKAAVC